MQRAVECCGFGLMAVAQSLTVWLFCGAVRRGALRRLAFVNPFCGVSVNRTLFVQVFSSETKHLKGGEGAKAYDFHVQKAYVTGPDPVPMDIEVMLPDRAPPYPPGIYMLAGGALGKRATIIGQRARVVVEFASGAPLIPLKDALQELINVEKAAGGPAAGPALRAAS